MLDFNDEVCMSMRRQGTLLCAMLLASSVAQAQGAIDAERRCGRSYGAPPIDIRGSIGVAERARNGGHFLLYGAQELYQEEASAMFASRRDQKELTDTLDRAVGEVDPRSTLVVRFGSARIQCMVTFSVRLSGRIVSGGTQRALEIPGYFEAGVKQREPRSRTLLLRNAVQVFREISGEATQARIEASRHLSARSVDSSEFEIALRSLLNTNLKVIQNLNQRSLLPDTLRSSVDTATFLRGLQADSAALRARIEQNRSRLEAAIVRLNAAELVAQIESFRLALRALATVPTTRAAVARVLSDSSSASLLEVAAILDRDAVLLRSRLLVAQSVLQRADSIVAATPAAPEVALGVERLRMDYRQLERAYNATSDVLDELATLSTQVVGSSPIDPNFFSYLEIPEAIIPLSASSLREGETVFLKVEFVGEDGSVLGSALLQLEARRLGNAVQNLRDVALFVNRCSADCFGSRSWSSASDAAATLRSSFLGLDRVDQLRLAALPRSVSIPNQERFIPAPGVVLEALVRPRLGGRSWFSKKIAPALRLLRPSYGLSVSFVSFSDRVVEISVPSYEKLAEIYEFPVAQREVAADSVFSLQATNVSRQELAIAPAIHLGLFEGAVSFAYGYNLRTDRSPRFLALGFSFIGLTEAGSELLSSLLPKK